jgi:signal transduction histidine kinase/ActR/RegA family two-component response regulator
LGIRDAGTDHSAATTQTARVEVGAINSRRFLVAMVRAGTRLLHFACVVLALALPGAGHAAPDEAVPLRLDRARFVLGDIDGRFPDKSQRVVMLPHAWELTNPRATGDGWYTLVWTLDRLPAMPQAIYLTAITAPTEVYLNGDLIGASGPLDGRLPHSYEHGQFLRIPADALHEDVNYIGLRVRARRPDVAGMGPVLVGNAVALRERATTDFVAHTLGPGAISIATFTVGVFIFVLWLRRRDTGYALFAIAVMLWSLHTLVSLAPEPLLPDPHWTVLWTSVYLLFVALLCLFCIRFAGVHWPAYERLVIAYACAMVPLLYGAALFHVLDPATGWTRLGGILMVVVALWAVARYAFNRWNLESALLLVAGAISVIFALHDWLASRNAIALWPVWLVPYAALAFLTLFGYLLTDRFVRALTQSEQLNVDLERRVEEKSAALSAQLQATQTAKEVAEAANRAKSSFLAAASHDLRQPMHALGMFSQALAEHAYDADARLLVQRITTSVSSLETLFSALLDVSKLDAAVVIAQPRDFAIRPLLDRLMEDCMPEVLERGLKLGIVCGDITLRSDPVLLERVLRNLVANALRYTNRGGVVIGCRRRGHSYALEVWDSGVGIPASELDRIFEEFYQVNNPSRDRSHGLGLGLAIVRRLGELLGHPVEVASRVGHGSVFRVRVPAGERAAIAVSPAGELASNVLAGARILVVDDEPDVRDGTERLLTRWGCDVIGAGDVENARCAYANGEGPDAMIIDFRLGRGIDGLDAITALRAAFGRATPAVLVSGESEAEALARIQASGVLLMHKPVPPARLRSVLAHLVMKRDEREPIVTG